MGFHNNDQLLALMALLQHPEGQQSGRPVGIKYLAKGWYERG